ncbi:hypothetical protein MBLNU459_g7787t1 [Dothideomycetes sp. NU459]
MIMASSSPTVYMIRHGEKPPKKDGHDQIGLSELGTERSEALVHVFGRDSQYNIDYIIAEHPKKDGDRARPYQTVKPLAKSLGVKFNHKIDRDDSAGVVDAVQEYSGGGNILICWEHGRLTDIATALGITPAPVYPDKRFDVIWTVPPPYDKIVSMTSEHCPGIDDAYANDP